MTGNGDAGGVMGGTDGAAATVCVTVVDGTRRMDLLLPTSPPCHELLPGLLRLLRPEDPGTEAGYWTVTPVGRSTLSGADSLADAQLVDGDVIVLTRADPAPAAPVTSDVRDRLEDTVEGRHARWTSGATVALLAWTLAGWALAAAPLAGLRMTPGPSGGLTAATLALALAAAAAVLGRRGYPGPASAVLAGACLWAGIGGWLAATGWPTPAPAVAGLAAGALASLILATVVAPAIPSAAIHLAASAVIALAAGASVALTGLAPLAAPRVIGPAATLCCGGVASLALAVGGISGADDRIGRNSVVPLPAVDRRIARADAVLVGILTGIALVSAGVAVRLAGSPNRWDGALAVGIGAALLLRTRALSQLRHVLPPLLGAVAVLGVCWFGAYQRAGPLQPLLICGVALGGAVTLFTVTQLAAARSAVARARLGRMLDLADTALVLLLVALAAGAFGLYRWIGAVAG